MRSTNASCRETELPLSTIRISMADMLALRVRTAESGNPPPKFLYQQLPPEAITLLATIPSGTAAVSIQQQNGRYPILKEFPAKPHDSYVVVYEHKPSRRYEAIKIFHQKESFDIAQFHEIACRWIDSNLGRLAPIPGKYTFIAPTRAQWGVILRDGGFMVPDPSAMVFGITPEILRMRTVPSASGLIVRAPVYSPPAVFVEVELTLDPEPGPDSRWMSFVEFQRMRAIRSRPPDSVIPLFREWLGAFAAESGFNSWIFRKGMFFGEHQEWWGESNRRVTSHEGIDFAEGLLPDGAIRGIPEDTPIHAIADGEAVAILDDFLNQTLIVRHPAIRDVQGDVFHTLYSHIHPAKRVMEPVARGEILGRVETSANAGAPTHMHLTGAWIPESVSASEITMDMMSAGYAPVTLINFNSLLVVDGQ